MARSNASLIGIRAVRDLIAQTPDEILSSVWSSVVDLLAQTPGMPPQRIAGWRGALEQSSGADLLRKYVEESISQEQSVSDSQLGVALRSLTEMIVDEIKRRRGAS